MTFGRSTRDSVRVGVQGDSEARATRDSVRVAVQGDGDARATRTSVRVAVNSIPPEPYTRVTRDSVVVALQGDSAARVTRDSIRVALFEPQDVPTEGDIEIPLLSFAGTAIVRQGKPSGGIVVRGGTGTFNSGLSEPSKYYPKYIHHKRQIIGKKDIGFQTLTPLGEE